MACQMVVAAVPRADHQGVLSCVKAAAQDDGLTLVAFDTEVGIRYELRGINVKRAGSAILPINQLTQILRESTDDEISLDATAEGTVVEGRHEPVRAADAAGGRVPGHPRVRRRRPLPRDHRRRAADDDQPHRVRRGQEGHGQPLRPEGRAVGGRGQDGPAGRHRHQAAGAVRGRRRRSTARPTR